MVINYSFDGTENGRGQDWPISMVETHPTIDMDYVENQYFKIETVGIETLCYST